MNSAIPNVFKVIVQNNLILSIRKGIFWKKETTYQNSNICKQFEEPVVLFTDESGEGQVFCIHALMTALARGSVELIHPIRGSVDWDWDALNEEVVLNGMPDNDSIDVEINDILELDEFINLAT